MRPTAFRGDSKAKGKNMAIRKQAALRYHPAYPRRLASARPISELTARLSVPSGGSRAILSRAFACPGTPLHAKGTGVPLSSGFPLDSACPGAAGAAGAAGALGV